MRQLRQSLISDTHLSSLIENADIGPLVAYLQSKYSIDDLIDEKDLSDLFSIVFSPLLIRATVI